MKYKSYQPSVGVGDILSVLTLVGLDIIVVGPPPNVVVGDVAGAADDDDVNAARFGAQFPTSPASQHWVILARYS